jgi:hypothetical protein
MYLASVPMLVLLGSSGFRPANVFFDVHLLGLEPLEEAGSAIARLP